MNIERTINSLNPSNMRLETYLEGIGINDSKSFISRISEVKRTMDIDRFGLREDLDKYAKEVKIPVEFIVFYSKNSDDFATNDGKLMHSAICEVLKNNYSQLHTMSNDRFTCLKQDSSKTIPIIPQVNSLKSEVISFLKDGSQMVPIVMTLLVIISCSGMLM